MVPASAAPRGAAMLTCRRALRGAEATTSAGAGGALLQRRVRSTQRAPARQAPSALLKVREDMRAAGAITWSQTPTEVTVRVALRGPLAGLARSDVACKFMPRKLRLSLDKGEPALDGELDEGYNLTGSFWQFDDAPGGGRVLTVVLEKLLTAGTWEYLLDTDVAGVDAEVTDKVFLEVAIDGAPEGRLTLGLFGKAAPRTVANFAALCTGEKGVGASGKALHYKGSLFHRIIPGFMAQAGDFTHGDGTGGESIYGEKFDDENFELKHSAPFLLSMANAGPNTNGSQFFVTTSPTPHLDGKHVVFGKVLLGQKLMKQIEQVGSGSGKPEAEVRIIDCGRLAM